MLFGPTTFEEEEEELNGVNCISHYVGGGIKMPPEKKQQIKIT